MLRLIQSNPDCAVKGVRRKEDPWNAIIAGFFTGGSLAIRCEFTHRGALEGVSLNDGLFASSLTAGPKTALGSGIMCGILLGVFEGVGVLMQRMMAEGNKQQAPLM